MTTPSYFPGYRDMRLAELIVLDVADIVGDFMTEWNYLINDKYAGDPSFRPCAFRVVRKVFDSIRDEKDAELELSIMTYHDITALAYYGVDSFNNTQTYNPANADLSNLTVKFGKSIIRRLRDLGVYCAGYLPYHFHAWINNQVVVALDAEHGGLPLVRGSEYVRYTPTSVGHSNGRAY